MKLPVSLGSVAKQVAFGKLRVMIERIEWGEGLVAARRPYLMGNPNASVSVGEQSRYVIVWTRSQTKVVNDDFFELLSVLASTR